MKDNHLTKGILHRSGAVPVVLFAAFDISIIAATHYFTLIANNVAQSEYTLFTLVFVLFAFLLVATTQSFYRPHRMTSIASEIFELLFFWIAAIGSLSAIIFSFEFLFPYNTQILKAWFIISPVILIFSRLMLRGLAHQLRSMGRNIRYVAIIGATDIGMRIYNIIDSNKWMGMNFLGFYDDRANERISSNPFYQQRPLNHTNELFSDITQGKVDIIYIALPMEAQRRIKSIIEKLSSTNVSIYYAPDFYSFDLLHARWDTIEGQPIISVIDTPFQGKANFIKRSQDVLLSSIALLILSPLMLLVALLIKYNSPGPVIYTQIRYGLDGKPFKIWKFRTMKNAATQHKFIQAVENDHRVTTLGKYLRKYSIDELPQLFNVLKGQMSIVGPRPHPVALDEEHQGLVRRYNTRYKVKPGITGWAQVSGFRGETDTIDKMEHRVKLDLEYINNWSILFDLKILYLTIWSVIKPKNAN